MKINKLHLSPVFRVTSKNAINDYLNFSSLLWVYFKQFFIEKKLPILYAFHEGLCTFLISTQFKENRGHIIQIFATGHHTRRKWQKSPSVRQIRQIICLAEDKQKMTAEHDFNTFSFRDSILQVSMHYKSIILAQFGPNLDYLEHNLGKNQLQYICSIPVLFEFWRTLFLLFFLW